MKFLNTSAWLACVALTCFACALAAVLAAAPVLIGGIFSAAAYWLDKKYPGDAERRNDRLDICLDNFKAALSAVVDGVAGWLGGLRR